MRSASAEMWWSGPSRPSTRRRLRPALPVPNQRASATASSDRYRFRRWPGKSGGRFVPSPGGKAPRGRCVRALVGRPRANRLALAGGRGAGGAALALDRVATGGAGADQVFLCDLPKELSLKRLVNTARGRWRMELDDQQRKEELGLDHFEGRSWTGGRHHVRLVMVAHLFLPLEQQQRRSSKRKRDPARDAA
jgi:hypothetical protein